MNGANNDVETANISNDNYEIGKRDNFKMTDLILDEDILERAEWFRIIYGLNAEEVFRALKRTNVSVVEEVHEHMFYYLSFTPSLETALKYFKPDVALNIFQHGDIEHITKHLIGLEKNFQAWADTTKPTIEELCRTRVEAFMLQQLIGLVNAEVNR